jgi:hypothetical protein
VPAAAGAIHATVCTPMRSSCWRERTQHGYGGDLDAVLDICTFVKAYGLRVRLVLLIVKTSTRLYKIDMHDDGIHTY